MWLKRCMYPNISVEFLTLTLCHPLLTELQRPRQACGCITAALNKDNRRRHSDRLLLLFKRALATSLEEMTVHINQRTHLHFYFIFSWKQTLMIANQNVLIRLKLVGRERPLYPERPEICAVGRGGVSFIPLTEDRPCTKCWRFNRTAPKAVHWIDPLRL